MALADQGRDQRKHARTQHPGGHAAGQLSARRRAAATVRAVLPVLGDVGLDLGQVDDLVP
jgi:hypothetical protein